VIDGSARVAAMTAIVHSADGVRFVTSGVCPEAVVSRLADYVRERCDHVLWADAASRVRAMLDVGNLYAAITLYFERVGERWDDERLELVTVEHDRARWASHEEMMADAR
jgi:hypothetical protein